MDWTVVGAVGEVIGAAAVVVSLLYLAREMRHGTQVARIAGIQSTNEKLFDWALTVSSDPELAALLARVQSSGAKPSDFSEAEQARITYLYHGLLNLTHTMFERCAEGLIGDAEIDRWAAKNRGLMGSPFLCALWPAIEPNFPDDYSRWLEARYNLPRPEPMT